eukprot:gene39529-48126_t
MHLTAKSDLSTGNSHHASYLLQSADVRMLFTAPYLSSHQNHAEILATNAENYQSHTEVSLPGFDPRHCRAFFEQHGIAVKSIAIEVPNDDRGHVHMAAVQLYGDVTLRILNTRHFSGNFLPNFVDVLPAPQSCGLFGIERIDHVVGNVPVLKEVVEYVQRITGFHEFAEFSAADVGTLDTGLNSVVLASAREHVLLPLNEPTYSKTSGKRSQIATYLEQNQGPGVQHIALLTHDIFSTLREMRRMSERGGFEFLAPPPRSYYRQLPERLGPQGLALLTPEQLQLAEEYGVLVDMEKEDNAGRTGLLLQIFTKPLGDRATIFIEIIQRIGCTESNGEQLPGCGGFGKGNFKALFRSIEEYETALGINK